MKVGINESDKSLEWCQGFLEGLKQAKRLFNFQIEKEINSYIKAIAEFKKLSK
jgi:hypothetical protein